MKSFVFPELHECFIKVDCLMLKIGTGETNSLKVYYVSCIMYHVSCIDRYRMIQAWSLFDN